MKKIWMMLALALPLAVSAKGKPRTNYSGRMPRTYYSSGKIRTRAYVPRTKTGRTRTLRSAGGTYYYWITAGGRNGGTFRAGKVFSGRSEGDCGRERRDK